MRRPPLPALLAAAALALAGCGGPATPDRPEVDAVLLLDGPPDAADAGIASAIERGFDGAEGVHLRTRPARSLAAARRALTTRRAELAVLPDADLARAPELVGVMAITSRGDGADARPQLVLVTARRRLDEDPSVSRAAVRALLRGYGLALVDPESSLSDLEARFRGIDRAAAAAELDRLGPMISPAGIALGTLPDAPRYAPEIVRGATADIQEP